MALVRRPFDAKDVGKMNTVSDCYSSEVKNEVSEHGFCTTFPQHPAPSAQRTEPNAKTQDQAPSTQGPGSWVLDLRS